MRVIPPLSPSLRAVVLPLLVASLVAILSPGAARGYVIGFNALPGNNLDPYGGHSEGGYTVTPTAGSWQVAKAFGNPTPDIFSASSVATVAVMSNSSGIFTFNKVDLGSASSGTNVPYTITGLLGASTQFTISGSTLPGNAFATISNPNPAITIDKLRITMNIGNTSSYNIDNIDVAPEPSAFAAMALCGFSGAAGMSRRPRASRTSGQ
jgi:hypothetical protein